MVELLEDEDYKIYGDRVKLDCWLRKYELDDIIQAIKLKKLVEERVKKLRNNDGQLPSDPSIIEEIIIFDQLLDRSKE